MSETSFPKIKLSLVIPAYNEEKLLPGTLTALKAAAAAAWPEGMDWELIVCDNNSKDETASIAASHGAKVVFEPVNQIGRARNTGASASQGEWLLFLDADSIPNPQLLRDLAAAMRDVACVGGGATLKMDMRLNLFGECLVWSWNRFSRLSGMAAGSFLFCRAEVFHDVGGFPDKLFAGEELELSKRLIKHGRSRRQKMKILYASPLVTSARKLKLYTPWEFMRFIFRSIFSLGRNLHKRESCAIWYDGRR